MKKIPTLFEKDYIKDDCGGFILSNRITPGCEHAFKYGDATFKWDGVCCKLFQQGLYKRIDSKFVRKIPPNSRMCQRGPDPGTGNWPFWAPVDHEDPKDKGLIFALRNTSYGTLREGCTYEAVGPSFKGNPHGYPNDILKPHGDFTLNIDRTYEGVKKFFEKTSSKCYLIPEGIVFWLHGEPVCKIKRSDYGYSWPSPTTIVPIIYMTDSSIYIEKKPSLIKQKSFYVSVDDADHKKKLKKAGETLITDNDLTLLEVRVHPDQTMDDYDDNDRYFKIKFKKSFILKGFKHTKTRVIY